MSAALERELALMLVEWSQAVAGPLKDALFNRVINFMIKNPGVGQHILTKAPVFAEAFAGASAAAAAAGAAAGAAAEEAAVVNAERIAFRQFLIRFAANFGGTPKGPNPYLIAAVFLGTVALSSAEVKAETMDRQNAIPGYEKYVTFYMNKMVQAKKFHPQNTFPSPKTFDEWFEQDYK